MNASVDLRQLEIARLNAQLEQAIQQLMSLKLSPEVTVTCNGIWLVIDIKEYGSTQLGLKVSSKYTEEAQIILLKQNIYDINKNAKDLKDFWLAA